MSQIAIVWRVVGPILLAHTWLRVARRWITSGLRLVLAFGTAVGVYGLAMLVTVELYPSDRPAAGLIYGAGMAVATWFGTCAGALAARTDHQQLVANAVAATAMAVVASLALQRGASGHAEAIYTIYVLGTGVGGLAAIRLLSGLPARRALAG